MPTNTLQFTKLIIFRMITKYFKLFEYLFTPFPLNQSVISLFPFRLNPPNSPNNIHPKYINIPQI